MNHQEFDTVVIGSGTSAYYAVDGLNKAGSPLSTNVPTEELALCADASPRSIW